MNNAKQLKKEVEQINMSDLKQLKKEAEQNNIPIVRDITLNYLLETVKKEHVKHILEIGTATGYSAINMLANNKKAKLVTLELDKERIKIARKNFRDFSLTRRITLMQGDAQESLQTLVERERKFDVVFLDGPKGQYVNYLPLIQNLLTDNGIIFSDNIYFGTNEDDDTNPKHKTIIKRLEQYRREIETPPFVSQFFKVDDGFAITTIENQ